MLKTGRIRPILGILTLLIIVMAVSATNSLAQTPKLTVTDVKAVQVIEDVPLIIGKSTVLKVVLTSSSRTSARLTVTLGASTKANTVKLNSGTNTLFIPVDPPTAPGTVAVTAKITTTSGTGGNQVSKTVEVVTLTKDTLKVILLPVDWTSQDRAKYFPARYNSFASQSSDFFKATYPIAESKLLITKSTTNFMLSADERAIADAQGNLNWQNIMAMYSSIALEGRRQMPDTDLVVGVLPPKWFARNLNDPNTVGLELQAVREAVANQVDSDYATLAHETGHVFGLVDDYDFSLNPPRIGNHLDEPGYWLTKSKYIITTAKPVYYSFMAASDPSAQYWVDSSTYRAILQTLQSGTLP
jgi:hypothetical protein